MRIFKYFLPLVFFRFWIFSQYTTWDLAYPVLSLLVLILGLRRGLTYSIIYPFLVFLIIPLFSAVVPINATNVQNFLILLPFAYGFTFKSRLISKRLFFFCFFLLAFLFYSNIAIGSLENYNMVTLLPFFDSVDVSFFYLLFLVVFWRIYRNVDSRNLPIIIGIVVCALGVILSGNRFSLLILSFIIVRFQKTGMILFYLVVLWFLKDLLLEYLILPFVPQKVVVFLSDKSIHQILTLDDSLLVRLRNFSTVWENSDFLNLMFGFGSELNWMEYLMYYKNTSMDNSLVVYFFTYGMLGVVIYFWLLRRIYKLAGFDITFVFLCFSMLQDVVGNFLYMSSLVLVIIVTRGVLSHD